MTYREQLNVRSGVLIDISCQRAGGDLAGLDRVPDRQSRKAIFNLNDLML